MCEVSVVLAVSKPSGEWKYMTRVLGKEICSEIGIWSYSPREEFLQEEDTEWEEEWKENSGVIKIEGEKNQWVSKID